MRTGDEYRVDPHPRCSRNGRIVLLDATHEGRGRQMYVIYIGYMLEESPFGIVKFQASGQPCRSPVVRT